MRRIVLLAVLASAGPALANGRPPATSTINFQRMHTDHVIAGMTFGTVESNDAGATWHWMCEDAVGYGGAFDPVYVYTESDALFATTFNGLRIRRDACVFDLQPQTQGCTNASDGGLSRCEFVSTVSEDADGNVFYAAADPNDAKIYRSADNGMTWPQSANPGVDNEWWESVISAPSNTQIVYVSGYFVTQVNNVPVKTFQLFKSADGGKTFTPMGVNVSTGLMTSMNSLIDITAIDPADPNTFYMTISIEDGAQQYGVWKTTNGGDSFTEVLHEPDRISFALRTDGDLVVGTQIAGSYVSHDKGGTWTALIGAPHINCLRENTLGELWACTANYGSMAIPPDPGGIMKTTDLATWTDMLHFQDIQDPVMCPGGTAQADVCVADNWCTLRQQLGITSTVIACAVAGDVSFPGDDGVPIAPGTPSGCCDSSGGAPTGLALAPLVAMVLRRRRRCSGSSTASPTTRSTSRS